ncbi:MAG: AbrB/MazE/SpoVT family DNA-binding domain-containing protein [Nitrospirae bacterium]|nr:AbrB/MazE/SpoVT family DNA-binding domain-containing protein [Nitrospirota bacterium]MCL5236435.1 AbrB/MazE/SpoVT family DNA-binding domain-containing protein [Nitrospirota bacterium]
MLVAIDKRGSVNLPSTIRKEMGLDTGTHLNLEVLEGGAIVLTPVAIYPAVNLNEKGLKKLDEARKSGTVKMPAQLAKQIKNARTDAD